MSGRIEHYNEPDAPRPNRLIPAASAVVTDESGAILLLRRTDNDLWTIPGGAMEPGESIADAAVRETREETGLVVEPIRIVGVYSNPRHVVEYADGEVRQQFSVCFACRRLFGEPTTSEESSEVGFYPPDQLAGMPIHDSIRLRIQHFLEGRPEAFIG